MFSVDNFYDCFCSNWGWNKTKNFVMIFQPHGSKDLHNLVPFGIGQNTVIDLQTKQSYLNKIIMHDQEPLFLDYLDTYRNMILTQKKSLIVVDDNQKNQLEIISKTSSIKSNVEMFISACKRGRNGHLIVCHSELNSKDIEILEKNGIISCYYWWHGMIARDWFRHWQHHDDLLPKNKSSSEHRFLLYARDWSGSRTYRKTIIDHCRQYQAQVLYNWNDDFVDSNYSAKIDIEDSNKSAIHLVAETLFDTEKIYLTEKVFKPMVMSQPFVIFGPPGSLVYLKRYGFKTFDNLWDESYDLEMDSNTRMQKILRLIDQLAEMSDREFDELYEKSLPLVEYNRQRFFSQSFQDELILEMRTNLERALLEQNQRHQHGLNDKSSTDSDDV